MVEDIGGESRQFVNQEPDSCFSPTISHGFLGSPQGVVPPCTSGKINKKNPYVSKAQRAGISSSIKWVRKRAPHYLSFDKISVLRTFLSQTQS